MPIHLSFKEWDSDILQLGVYAFIFSPEFNALSHNRKLSHYKPMLPATDKHTLYTARIPAKEHQTRWFLESQGWHVIECYVELKHTLQQFKPAPSNIEIREYQPKDLNHLATIAAHSFTEDRFHTDPDISKTHADQSRKEWVENACNGRAKKVFVALNDNTPIGFLLVMEKVSNDQKYGVIDLIAVDKKHRGHKAGAALVHTFIQYAQSKHYTHTLVGTQAHNIASLRLYEKCGFMVHNTFYTLHRHTGQP
jgi:ribosomal protein S18 acetylase RimI-like enzyme